MQKFLHEFDTNFFGTFDSEIDAKNKKYFLLSSVMEEAIASSQMEGAVTTRKVAKNLLRKKSRPADKSQQMILNNYETIRFLTEHKSEKLSPELLLEIHRRISENTLENPQDEGNFRSDDQIVVMDELNGEIAHFPPPHEKIRGYVSELCDFANDEKKFIHPIVKAVIIHFMISFLHPFADGNGRTARSLFYWFMLKKGYRLAEFLSISRVIYKSKRQYEKSFLYVENDGLDLGYFINYNLRVLQKSVDELKIYLDKKKREKNLLEIPVQDGMNERQSQILKSALKNPSAVFVCKEFEPIFSVSVKTIRADLEALAESGLMERIRLNRRLTGYRLSKNARKNPQ